MFTYGLRKSSQDSENNSVELYNRRTSESWQDEEEERDSWHQQFPSFTFLKQLSTTQSSTVWMVQDKQNKQIFAAKIIPNIENENSDKSHQVEQLQFLQKIQLQLSVRNYKIHASADFYLILMEYLKEGDLASYNQNYAKNAMHKFSQDHLKWVRFCFKQIVNAVQQLHQNGYVHRDLKPQNFLIDDQGHLKLNDFGLVIKEKSTDASFCGTPTYMAPERLDSKKYKLPILHSSDMWSLGIILYQLLTGQVPYEEDDKQEILQLIYGNFIHFDPKISVKLRNLITQLLQINPAKRMTIQELKDDPYIRNQ